VPRRLGVLWEIVCSEFCCLCDCGFLLDFERIVLEWLDFLLFGEFSSIPLWSYLFAFGSSNGLNFITAIPSPSSTCLKAKGNQNSC